MNVLELRLFGPGELHFAGQVQGLERKTAGLLTYLALEGSTPRALIAGLLWPESGESQARTNLRKVLSRLKPWPELLAGNDVLRLGDEVVCDLRDRAKQKPALSAELLAGQSYDDCIDFADWLWVWRERLRDENLAVLSVELAKLEAEGELEAALMLARQLMQLEPLAESHYRRVMRLQFYLGDRGAALETYKRCQKALKEALGLSPLAETQNLARDIEQNTLAPFITLKEKPPAELGRLPFAGRENLMAELTEVCQTYRFIVLSGEAGLGKTRFLQEYFAEQSGVLFLGVSSGGETIPLSSLRYVLSQLLDDAIKQRLEPWALQELVRLLPELEAVQTVLEPSEDRLQEACLEVFRLVGGNLSTLIIEDLHFWDFASFAFLPLLFEAMPEVKIVASCRPFGFPESLQTLMDKAVAVKLELSPLPVDAFETILGKLGLKSQLPDAASLQSLTQGNPLYLGEGLKAALKPGQWQLKESIIQERLTGLSEVAEQVIWTMALNGGRLELELSAAMLTLKPLSLGKQLQELQDAQLLKEDALSHDLFAEYVREKMPAAVKALLHSRAAEFLSQTAKDAARAAEHWFLAKAPLKAVEQWQIASDYLYTRGLTREALNTLERALAHSNEPDLQFTGAKLYLEIGDYDKALTVAKALEESSDEPWVQSKVHHVRADYLLTLGKISEAKNHLKKAQELANLVPSEAFDRDLQVLAMHVAYAEGDFAAVQRYAAQILERARQKAEPIWLAKALSDMGVALSSLGQLEESLRFHYEARALGQKHGLKSQQFQSANNLSVTYALLGNLSKAAELSEEALEQGRFHGYDTVRGNLAVYYADLGHYDKAIALSLDLSETGAQTQERIYAFTRLAELYDRTAEQEKIQPALLKAIELASQIDDVAPRLRTLINTVKYGNKDLHPRVLPWLEGLKLEQIRPDTREELEDLGLIEDLALDNSN